MKPRTFALDVKPVDEATSALDPRRAAGGMTMICVPPEMTFAREVSDRVAFFHKGVMAEGAPPADLFDARQHPETQAFLKAAH